MKNIILMAYIIACVITFCLLPSERNDPLSHSFSFFDDKELEISQAAITHRKIDEWHENLGAENEFSDLEHDYSYAQQPESYQGSEKSTYTQENKRIARSMEIREIPIGYERLSPQQNILNEAGAKKNQLKVDFFLLLYDALLDTITTFKHISNDCIQPSYNTVLYIASCKWAHFLYNLDLIHAVHQCDFYAHQKRLLAKCSKAPLEDRKSLFDTQDFQNVRDTPNNKHLSRQHYRASLLLANLLSTQTQQNSTQDDLYGSTIKTCQTINHLDEIKAQEGEIKEMQEAEKLLKAAKDRMLETVRRSNQSTYDHNINTTQRSPIEQPNSPIKTTSIEKTKKRKRSESPKK